MKLTIPQLRSFIRESIDKALREAIAVDDDEDELDLDDPTIIRTDKYGMADQETSTQLANLAINPAVPNDTDVATALAALIGKDKAPKKSKKYKSIKTDD